MKKAVLLVNVGTPDTPAVRDVRRFLARFLNDPYVIHIPWVWRKLLVNMLIVPFRSPKSAALYRKLWTDKGSPIRYYLDSVRDDLQKILSDQVDIWAAMNYGNPNLSQVLNKMQDKGYHQITVIPLFPQYALSTTGSVEHHVLKDIDRWPVRPEVVMIRQFYDQPVFLHAWLSRILPYHPENYDQIIFSFHGLPLSHLPEPCRHYRKDQNVCSCSKPLEISDLYVVADYCYKAACYDMADKMAKLLELTKTEYIVAFQSRMSRHWLEPFTDRVLEQCAAKKQKVLVIALSFVADCLETNVELGIEYKQMFFKRGGTEHTLVESLNDQPEWIHALATIIAEVPRSS